MTSRPDQEPRWKRWVSVVVALFLLGCAFSLLGWREKDRAKLQAGQISAAHEGVAWLDRPGNSSAVVEVHGKPDGNGGFVVSASDFPTDRDPRDFTCPEALGNMYAAAFVWKVKGAGGKSFADIPYRIDVTASYVMYETPISQYVGPLISAEDWFVKWGGAATLKTYGASPDAAIRCLQADHPEMALLSRCSAPGIPCTIEHVIRPAFWAFGWGIAGALAFTGALGIGVWLGALWVLRVRRKRSGTCEACGYNLAGLPKQSLCPECGRVH